MVLQARSQQQWMLLAVRMANMLITRPEFRARYLPARPTRATERIFQARLGLVRIVFRPLGRIFGVCLIPRENNPHVAYIHSALRDRIRQIHDPQDIEYLRIAFLVGQIIFHEVVHLADEWYHIPPRRHAGQVDEGIRMQQRICGAPVAFDRPQFWLAAVPVPLIYYETSVGHRPIHDREIRDFLDFGNFENFVWMPRVRPRR